MNLPDTDRDMVQKVHKGFDLVVEAVQKVDHQRVAVVLHLPVDHS